MGEGGSRFEGGEFDAPVERSPEIEDSREAREKEKCALAIEKLLAKIVESGPELDPAALKALRAQVQSLLAQLGLKGLTDPMLVEIIARVHRAELKIRTPEGYPSQKEFLRRYREVLAQRRTDVHEKLLKDPNLSELIAFAHASWDKVKARGIKANIHVEDYLYELGRIISFQRNYGILFPDHDQILVGSDWEVQNGQHRVLTLKCLGSGFINRPGVSNWIKPKLER